MTNAPPEASSGVLRYVLTSKPFLITLTGTAAVLGTLLAVQRDSKTVIPLLITALVSVIGIVLQFLSGHRQMETQRQLASEQREWDRQSAARDLRLDLYERLDAACRELVAWADVQAGPMPPTYNHPPGTLGWPIGQNWPNAEMYGTPPPHIPDDLLRASDAVRSAVQALRYEARHLATSTEQRGQVPPSADESSMYRRLGEHQTLNAKAIREGQERLVALLRAEILA